MEKNISEKLDGELYNLVCVKMYENLVNILKETPYKAICLDIADNDSVYGYIYDGDGILTERQVKGLTLDEYGHVWCCLDVDCIKYSLGDLLDEDKTEPEQWYNLLHSELLGWFTMININEAIHEYI